MISASGTMVHMPSLTVNIGNLDHNPSLSLILSIFLNLTIPLRPYTPTHMVKLVGPMLEFHEATN